MKNKSPKYNTPYLLMLLIFIVVVEESLAGKLDTIKGVVSDTLTSIFDPYNKRKSCVSKKGIIDKCV